MTKTTNKEEKTVDKFKFDIEGQHSVEEPNRLIWRLTISSGDIHLQAYKPGGGVGWLSVAIVDHLTGILRLARHIDTLGLPTLFHRIKLENEEGASIE